MFTKQKVYKHVIFIKQKCTDKLCLQNKTKIYLQFMFTKQNKMPKDKLCLQNIQMFTKQRFYTQVMFKNQKQNKKFTDKLCLQNKTK